MPIIPVLGRLRQEFGTTLGYIAKQNNPRTKQARNLPVVLAVLPCAVAVHGQKRRLKDAEVWIKAFDLPAQQNHDLLSSYVMHCYTG